MRGWPIMLGGLIIWAVHFFVLYGAAEFAADRLTTRIAIGAFTLLCFAGQLFLLACCLRMRSGGFERWRSQLGAFAAMLGAIAVIWQGLPLLF